ncbi:MAG: anti-sigma F factor [Clostridia bacterium]|nr:anti-sigma F factor [Clostridia bacterium]
MQFENKFKLEIDARLENEGFIRSMVTAFAVQINPTLSEINDIKTAVSEAITNSIVHGYNGKAGKITVVVGIKQKLIDITIIDNGVGIDDIERAKQPFFTTRAKDERSGMGFTLMESFMDSLSVKNNPDGGLIVNMTKAIN